MVRFGKRNLIAAAVLVLLAVGCKDKIYVVSMGDSWSQQWVDAMVDEIQSRGVAVEAWNKGIPGSTASVWAMDGALVDVKALLLSHPEIEWLTMSMGGNDLLDGYLLMGYGESAFPLIDEYIRTVIGSLLTVRPNLKISLNAYDYPNFEMSAECIVMGQAMLGGNTLWKNQLFEKLTLMAQDIDEDYPQVTAVNLLGALQEAGGVPYAPNPNKPSPMSMMGEGDCIHPNYDGYRAVMARIYDGFFGPLNN